MPNQTEYLGLNYLSHIVRFVESHKRTKEWLISAVAVILGSMLAYRLAFYPGSTSAPLIVGTLILVITVWRPVYGMAVYLLAYPTVPSTESLNLAKMGILALTILLFGLWWWENIKSRKKPWLSGEYRWLFIFFAYLCLSPILGLRNGFSVMDWARDIAPLLNLLLIPVMVDHLKNKYNRWLLYLVFIPVGLGLFRDFLYLASRYGMVNTGWLLRYPIRLSTFHPAAFFGLGLVLYLQKADHRHLWLLVSLLGAGLALLTPTRTVWLSLGFMAVLLLLFYSQHRKKAIAGMALILVLLGLSIFRSGRVSESQSDRWDQMIGYKSDLSVKSRFDELYQSIDLFKSSPVYGVGFGYQYHFWRNWVNAYKGSGYMDTNYTHNDIINVIAKGGLAGFTIFGLMIYGLMRKLAERRKYFGEPVAKAWATLGIIAIIQSVFVGLSTPVYQTREAIFLLAVLIAIALSYERKKAPDA